jgi:hypothetical protein
VYFLTLFERVGRRGSSWSRQRHYQALLWRIRGGGRKRPPIQIESQSLPVPAAVPESTAAVSESTAAVPAADPPSKAAADPARVTPEATEAARMYAESSRRPT